ncbi:MAG: haloacid dehalogenase-like hydrolase [Longimicrobiales bacterium]
MRRLLLFDIDGTLVSGGPAKTAFQQALVDTYGTHGPIEVTDFSGKTDPQIARELLRGAGLGDDAIDAGLPRLFERYLAGLEAGLPANPMAVLPGVPDLIDALGGTGDVALALLTGNIEDGARLKLAGSGLAERFVTGSFGSDREFRDDLPPVAMERAAATWGVTFAAEEVFVIGDTPRDVACGQAHGTRTVAVATGRFDAEVLERTGATHVVPDFSDTQRVFELLTA